MKCVFYDEMIVKVFYLIVYLYFLFYILKVKDENVKKINRKIEVKKELCVFSYIVGLVEGEIFLLDDIFY